MKFTCTFILTLLVVVSCSSKGKPRCLENHGVVEYGTSRVKLLVAEVNVCQKKFSKIVKKMEWEAETDKHVLKDFDGSLYISRSVLDTIQGISQEARSKLLESNVTRTYAFATGIYRKLSTSTLILQNYSKKLGTKIDLLSNPDEALMGVISIQAIENPGSKFVVWDFGGNSMQFYIVNEQKRYPLIGFPGSTPIRSEISSHLRKPLSPNPVGSQRVNQLEDLLWKKFFSGLSSSEDLSDFKVIGIGGVHTKSILGNLSLLTGLSKETKTYSFDHVAELVRKISSLSDHDIGGKYPESQATNAIAVHLIMHHMAWKEVKVSDQSIALGYLVAKLSQNK